MQDLAALLHGAPPAQAGVPRPTHHLAYAVLNRAYEFLMPDHYGDNKHPLAKKIKEKGGEASKQQVTYCTYCIIF